MVQLLRNPAFLIVGGGGGGPPIKQMLGLIVLVHAQIGKCQGFQVFFFFSQCFHS